MSSMEPTISDVFWEKLEVKYKLLSHGAKEWVQEHKPLETIIAIIQKDVSFRYKIIEPLGVGGIGIVLQVEDKNLGIPCALKFPRPKAGKESLFAEIIESEIAQLLKARHPNIIEVYYQGSIQFEGTQFSLLYYGIHFRSCRCARIFQQSATKCRRVAQCNQTSS